MKRFPLFVLMIATLFLVAATGAAYLSVGRQSTALARRPLQEIVAYTTLPTEAAAALSEAYEKEYNIRVSFVPLSAEQIQKRLEEQAGSGVSAPAALVLADREVLDRAAAAGYLVPYQSERSDQDYLRTHLDLPDSWQLLAQQKDIRIGTTDFMAADASSNLLYSMIAEYGEQRTFAIWRRIQPQIMQYSRYLHTPVRQAGMGEVDVSVAVLSETLRYIHDDYPIRVLYPTDGTAAVIYGTGVAFRAGKHDVQAAEDFADWLLTDEAQLALARQHIYFLTTNPVTLSYRMFAGKNINIFKSKPYYSPAEKKILLDRWVKQVRFYEE